MGQSLNEDMVSRELLNSTNYNQGKKHGLEIWYHENGREQSEVLYENDAIKSILLRWDEDGNQITN